MKAITMREFARLCTDDPALYKQVLAIPGSICPEKVFALAEKNGYQILQEGAKPEASTPVPLDMEQLDRVTGGTEEASNENRMQDWLTWLHIWVGVGA